MSLVNKCYRCPFCARLFWVSGVTRYAPPPDRCPVCDNTGIAPEKKPELYEGGMPAILKGVARHNVDKTYRQIEEGSRFRADLAQEQFGLDSDQAKELIISDMKDNAKVGEDSVAPLTVAQSQMHANANTMSAPGALGQAGITMGQLHAGATQGPHPYAGSKAMSALREVHSRSGAPMADNPSLEWKRQHGVL